MKRRKQAEWKKKERLRERGGRRKERKEGEREKKEKSFKSEGLKKIAEV